MNKQDLIKKMAADAGITQDQARSALQAFEHGVTEALIAGDSVQMIGFGAFKPSLRKARTGRNPKTGEAIDIPAKTAVSFVAGKALKEAVN
ncbi:HU family DNA-binding protein [Psychrobacter aquaticus]|uniref:DNA-binding protein HU-alpha n=1 Tax=Psychrobacter aquaticus CMS 56 TaxID=1354303 RepID=U4TCI1_9GAMM|nr:HU family DNA-binding protein [Psychrobacter aquaticus]ERL56173.1 DNA-binding protein HU-alpha [Psychrobacter aquaticus CMS 56]